MSCKHSTVHNLRMCTKENNPVTKNISREIIRNVGQEYDFVSLTDISSSHCFDTLV